MEGETTQRRKEESGLVSVVCFRCMKRINAVYGWLWGYMVLLVVLAFLLKSQIFLSFTVFLLIGCVIGFLIMPLIEAVLLEMDHEPQSLGGFLSALRMTLGNPSSVTRPVHPSLKAIYGYPFLFGFALVAAAVLFSGAAAIGRGVILGCGLFFVLDVLVSSTDKQVLRARWFSLFPTPLKDKELDVFVLLSIVVFGVLTLVGVSL